MAGVERVVVGVQQGNLELIGKLAKNWLDWLDYLDSITPRFNLYRPVLKLPDGVPVECDGNRCVDLVLTLRLGLLQ